LSAQRHSKRAGEAIDHAADAADRIISMKATNAITGWSRGSTYRLVAAGLHPKPVKMGACKVGFVEREVREYVAAKLQGRDAAPPQHAGA
jgi:prophage regulatory protein